MTATLKGRTLFITGGSRGIGREIALRAARDGANVAIAAKTSDPHPRLAGTIHTVAEEIVKAGGAGVFIDNSALAHGGQDWLEMTQDGGPDALSFAFVGIVRGKTEISTMGMHVLGLGDVVMNRADVESGAFPETKHLVPIAEGEFEAFLKALKQAAPS